MELYKKFSNLFDANIIKQLSNKDILISSSNQIKLYSINTFDKLYNFKEIKSAIIYIKSIYEINPNKPTKKNETILSFYLSDFTIQIIKLTKKINNKPVYRHKLHQTLDINPNIKNVLNPFSCINSFLNYLIIGINNRVRYYINKGEENGKINFVKEKEHKINHKLNTIKYTYNTIKGISCVIYKKYKFVIVIEEIQLIKQFDIKIFSFEKFELITYFNDVYLSPEKGLKGLLSYMTCPDEKILYLILGDNNDRIMIIKLFDDFDIYDNISLSKIIKELSFNRNSCSNDYEIKSICGLNDGTFIISLYYNKALYEKNYIIRGRINPKNKKFELLYINDNVHNNKSNFITSSTFIENTNNKKIKEEYFISGDHEGMIKLWKYKKYI